MTDDDELHRQIILLAFRRMGFQLDNDLPMETLRDIHAQWRGRPQFIAAINELKDQVRKKMN